MTTTELWIAGISATAAFIGAIATVVSAFAAFKSAAAAKAAVLAAERATETARDVAKSQALLSQRQLLLPLWQYMTTLNAIDTTAPLTDDVLKAVHTLELVALCCEGGMVDPQVIKRTFRDVFLAVYESIEQCAEIPRLDRSGPALLRENRAAMRFYEELRDEHMNAGKLTTT